VSVTPPICAGILTISDRCSQGLAIDASGPALAALARDRLHADITRTACIPDDHDQIVRTLTDWSAPSHALDLVLSTGGTGLSPRDVTPEAAMQVIQRPAPGLMELARARTAAASPRSYLSRGVAGVAHRTLILTLPGSPRGAAESLEALLDLLPHAIHILRGRDHGGRDQKPQIRDQ
jgi:molybdenum cofactor synthesis domain-containing protein